MTWFGSVLFWLSTFDQAESAFQFIGRWATRALRRRGGAKVGGGIEFFPNRDALVRAHGTLGSRLRSASSSSGLWVVGQKFFGARENVGVLKRLLLPHPNGEAIKYYAKVSQHQEVTRYIREWTGHALKSGTKVRWYQPFVFSSIVLVDTDKPEGWAHIEIVLPYSEPERRPSFTVFRRRSEETVAEFQRIFDELWDNAEIQEVSGQTTGTGPLATAIMLDTLFQEGVAHRNALIPAVADFDFGAEKERIVEWQDKVLAQCHPEHVPLKMISSFKTLNLFDATFHPFEGKSKEQEKAESIWTEKLNRLRVIIEEVGK